MSKENLTPEEFKSALFAFAYGDAEASFVMSPKEVADDLKAEGINPDKAVAALRERMRSSLGKQRLANARAERETFLQRVFADVPGQARQLLDSLNTINPDSARAFARKFEEAPDEQTRQSILQDLLLAQAREQPHDPKT